MTGEGSVVTLTLVKIRGFSRVIIIKAPRLRCRRARCPLLSIDGWLSAPALRDRDADMSAVLSSSIAASRVARSTPRRRSLPRASSGSDVDARTTSAKMDKGGESDFGSILNWRDLGSTPGTRVAPGRVFRTATPGRSSEEDAATIISDIASSSSSTIQVTSSGDDREKRPAKSGDQKRIPLKEVTW